MKIRPLKVPSKLNGFNVELADRLGMVAILRKTLPTSDLVNYEVVIIQVGPPHPNDSQAIAEGWDAVERLPHSESWGRYGWTFCTQEEAKAALHRQLEILSAGSAPEEYDEEP